MSLTKMKMCSKCGEIKSLDNFHKNWRNKDGYNNRCKQCVKEYHANHYKNNKEEILNKQKEYYENNKEKYKENYDKWRKTEKGKESLSQAKSKYRKSEKGKEKSKKDTEKYRKSEKGKEKIKEYWKSEQGKIMRQAVQNNRKAMKLALPQLTDNKEWEEILKTYNNKCAVTGKSKPALEHFIPLSWGHAGTIKENIYPLHGSLNGVKSSRNPFVFLEELKGKQYEAFQQVIRNLAELNGLTYKEFHQYVNWCEKHKRTVEEVLKDNIEGLTSVELWKKSLAEG